MVRVLDADVYAWQGAVMEFMRSWYVPPGDALAHPVVLDVIEGLDGDVRISARLLNYKAAKEPDASLPPTPERA